MSEKEVVINEDEMIGHIMRTLKEQKDVDLFYSDVRAVMDAQFEFMKDKGLISNDS